MTISLPNHTVPSICICGPTNRTHINATPCRTRSIYSLRKQIKIRPGYTPQEDVRRFRGTRQQQAETTALPKGHIIGWTPPPTSTAPKPGTAASSAATKAAKKNEKRKEKRKEKRDTEKVKDSWEDEDEDGPNSGAQDGSHSADSASPQTTKNVAAVEKGEEDTLPTQPPADGGDGLTEKLQKLEV